MWVCLVWTICITSATNTYAKVTGSKKCHICSFFSRKVIEMKTAVSAHLTAHLCPLVTAVLSLSQTFPSFLNIFHKRLVKIANMNTQLVGTSFSVLNWFLFFYLSTVTMDTLFSLCDCWVGICMFCRPPSQFSSQIFGQRVSALVLPNIHLQSLQVSNVWSVKSVKSDPRVDPTH